MCGIVGAVPAVPEKAISEALRLIHHRGPDGTRVWIDDDYRVALGHTRLAIIDLSEAAAQPMHSQRYVLIYNGEIYNYLEIKSQLTRKGYSFKSGSDTEVLLYALEEWGTACLPRLNGMWAFALWDKKEKSLLLCRDRFGEKPLYYSQQQGRLLFASEMKSLMPFIHPVELNPEFPWMIEHLLEYEATGKCLIKGIYRLPPSHYAIYRNGQLKLYRYWNTLDHLHPVPASYKQQVEEFRALFLDACKLRLRSDVPVGSALSGGIDSTAVVSGMAYVSRHMKETMSQPSWQHAFVATFPETPLDESRYARLVGDFLGIQTNFIRIDPCKALADFEENLFALEDIYITHPAPMIQTYAAMRNQRVLVSIDGHGADELFAGYGTFVMRALVDCGLNPFAIRNILKTYRLLAEPGQSQFIQEPASFKNYLRWITGRDTIRALFPFLWKEIKKALRQPETLVSGNSGVDDPSKLGFFNASLYKLFHQDNLPALLRNYDRCSMANGVEIRMPFLDHRVVCYCFSVPWTSKLKNGYTKSLFRDAIKPFAPSAIVKRHSKMGFQTPIVNWLKGPWKDYFLSIINSPEFDRFPYHNAINVRKQILNVIENEVTYRQAELAYTAISPYLWYRSVFNRYQSIRKVDTSN